MSMTPRYEHQRVNPNGCTALMSAGGCSEIGTAYVVASCAHEHLREGLVCAGHLAALGRDSCRTCVDPARTRFAHDCALSLLEVQHRDA